MTRNFKYSILCAMVTLPLSCMMSCVEYEPFTDQEFKDYAYQMDFIKEFGKPAPKHQWGYELANHFMGLQNPVTRAIYKQDMTVPTTNESGQQVWVSVTDLYGKPADITRHEHDEVYAWFTNHKVNWQKSYANCGDGNSFTGSTKDFDGIAYSRSGEEGYTMLDMGSLATYSPGKLGNCQVDVTRFFNGWIQYVNSDSSYDEVADDGANKYSCSNMNNLKIVDINGSYQVHLNEFNGAGGYGWGKQSGQNAILATDSNFNEVEYHCSADSKYHDKYIIVHLTGDDYSGWYLGMDFEGSGPNSNQRVKADGVCNDWIIKISDAGQSFFNPARILCEDLGSNDFDFNDIVFDIAAKIENDAALVTVTVKAVGGTLPVCLCYDGQEFCINGVSELHELLGVPVNCPVNVDAYDGCSSVKDVSWKIGFGKVYNEAQYNYPDQQLNLQKFNVLIQQGSRAEWLTIRSLDSRSTLHVPQMICVPATVEWPEEFEPITTKYPKFRQWVENPTQFFWTAQPSNSGNQNTNNDQIVVPEVPQPTVPDSGSGEVNGSEQEESASSPIIPESAVVLWSAKQIIDGNGGRLTLSPDKLPSIATGAATLNVYYSSVDDGVKLHIITSWSGSLDGNEEKVLSGGSKISWSLTENDIKKIIREGLVIINEGGNVAGITKDIAITHITLE